MIILPWQAHTQSTERSDLVNWWMLTQDTKFFRVGIKDNQKYVTAVVKRLRRARIINPKTKKENPVNWTFYVMPNGDAFSNHYFWSGFYNAPNLAKKNADKRIKELGYKFVNETAMILL